MSIYAELTFKILSALTSSKKQIGFKREEDTTSKTVRSDISEEASGTIEVADATVDLSIPFAGVTTGKIMYLETDRELTVKLNGSSNAHKLSPTTGAKAKLMWEGEFTNLKVSNASGGTAVFTYYIAG